MTTSQKSERPLYDDWPYGIKDGDVTFLFSSVAVKQVRQQRLSKQQQWRRERQWGSQCKEEGKESQSGEGEKREETTQRGETGQNLSILRSRWSAVSVSSCL